MISVDVSQRSCSQPQIRDYFPCYFSKKKKKKMLKGRCVDEERRSKISSASAPFHPKTGILLIVAIFEISRKNRDPRVKYSDDSISSICIFPFEEFLVLH